jgi:hypothetical protein
MVHGKKSYRPRAGSRGAKGGEPGRLPQLMTANYYASLANSSWLTHVATSSVTLDTPPQDLEDPRIVFTQVP